MPLALGALAGGNLCAAPPRACVSVGIAESRDLPALLLMPDAGGALFPSTDAGGGNRRLRTVRSTLYLTSVRFLSSAVSLSAADRLPRARRRTKNA
jgi:hypothetical protein